MLKMVPFWFLNYNSIEQLIIIATVVFLTILLAELFDCCKFLSIFESSYPGYGYEHYNGPIVWKCHFPKSRGKCQSPINISTQNVCCVPSETLKPIKFSSEYYNVPSSIIAMNDGHSLIVCGCWNHNAVPKISGGPLCDTYRFDSARFRWGPTDQEGSEHTIDSMRYAMEIQAAHIKGEKRYGDIVHAAEDKALLVISYLFQITPVDNPYLEPLLAALKMVLMPCSHCSIEPFPLSWLVLPFTSKYYHYCGSLTFPPCSEYVEWLVQSETLSISARQVKKFRKLCSLDGPIESNTRPVQDLNGRDLYFYD